MMPVWHVGSLDSLTKVHSNYILANRYVIYYLFQLSTSKDAIACGSSCLGRSTLSAGFYNFTCNGNESRLTDCPRNSNNGCGEDAGVLCSKCCS